eukprot:SAG11_NODE_12126_length_720_cov_1.697262_1_plen_132_part_01
MHGQEIGGFKVQLISIHTVSGLAVGLNPSDMATTATLTGSNIKGDYTAYTIRCANENGGAWAVERRYSEFAKLRKDLSKAGCDVEAAFPKKKPFGGKKTAVVEQREEGLMGFIAVAVAKYGTNPLLIEFLAN